MHAVHCEPVSVHLDAYPGLLASTTTSSSLSVDTPPSPCNTASLPARLNLEHHRGWHPVGSSEDTSSRLSLSLSLTRSSSLWPASPNQTLRFPCSSPEPSRRRVRRVRRCRCRAIRVGVHEVAAISWMTREVAFMPQPTEKSHLTSLLRPLPSSSHVLPLPSPTTKTSTPRQADDQEQPSRPRCRAELY
jgi:hypothetical protein